MTKSALSLLSTRRHFRALWLSGFISLIGDWFSFVALSHFIVSSGHGALSIALLFVLHSAPSALLAPIAGIFLDRFDRRALLVYTRWIQMFLTLLMLFAASSSSVIGLQLLVLLRSSLSAFVVPAEAAMLRGTVEEDELLLANTIDSTTWSFSFVIGMALGGFVAAIDPRLALLLDASSFMLAALVLWNLPTQKIERAGAASIARLRAEFREAWEHARHRPMLFRLLWSKAPVAWIGGSAWVLLNVRAEEMSLFGSGAISFGILQSIKGVGTALGPLGLHWLTSRGVSTRVTFEVALWMTILGVALFLSDNALVMGLGSFLWGAGVGGNWVLASAELQKNTADEVSGRLFALDYFAMTIASCSAAMFGAILLSAAGESICLFVSLVIGAASWFYLWKAPEAGWLAQKA
jgi:MFS family permease